MELPPCPDCGGEPDDRCPLCGREPALAVAPTRALPFVKSYEWHRLHARLATGELTPRRIAEWYGRHIEDVIAWLYPGIERGRPVPVK